MAFPTKLLQPDEELVLDLRPHWWFVAPAGAGLATSIVLGLATLNLDGMPGRGLRILSGVLILVALVYFGIRYARWATTDFVITTERVIFRQGLLSRSGTQMPLEKINSVDFSQSLFERLVGAGDLIIESGSDRGVQTFTDVPKPLAVQQEINHQMDNHEKQRWRGAGAGAGAEAPATGSIPDQIEKLAQLRDQGVLTEAEFQAKKAQLLDRL